MLETYYKATISGEHIEWDGDPPDGLKKNESVGVYVVLRDKDKAQEKSNGKKLAAIMEEMASRGGITSIKDPVKWQRKIRKDRPLPGR